MAITGCVGQWRAETPGGSSGRRWRRAVLCWVLAAGALAACPGSPAWAQGELFVVDNGGNALTVYSQAAGGNTAPIRTIIGPATGLNTPVGVALDSTNNELLVTNGASNSIVVHALGASGNVAPLRVINGVSTGLESPTGIALDLTHNEIFVASIDGDSIKVYSRTANGNVNPLRTLTGPATGLNSPGGIALDLTNNELFVANGDSNSITVYSRTANGNVAPLRTISGALTGLNRSISVAVDLANNELFVGNTEAGTVTVYSRTAAGNVAPLRTLTVGFGVLAVAVDSARNELLITLIGSDSVTVHARTASGHPAPLRTLGGPVTGLQGPIGIAINDRSAATVSSVTGPVLATLQGQQVVLGPASSIVKGMLLSTGAGGELEGACADGSHFRLSAGSSLFLDDALCQQIASGEVNLTEGQFSVLGGPPTLQAGAAAVFHPFNNVRTPVSVVVATSLDAEYTVAYSQLGLTGTSTISVTKGTVAVTDGTTGVVTPLSAGRQLVVNGQVPSIVAAILPASRSVQVPTTATAFGILINLNPSLAAVVCQVSPITNLPGTSFAFQTTDPNTNQLIGSKGTPVTIGPGGSQSFVLAVTPAGPLAPTDVQFAFKCGGTQAPVTVGLNTLLLSASATPVPDIVALGATAGNTGIVDIPGASGTGVFGVATVNVGAGGQITASATTGGVQLPINLLICQTDPATGVCQTGLSGTVTTQIGAGQTPTFAIFVQGQGSSVPFDPANNRITVLFKDANGVVRGATSVAVRTP